MSLFKGGLKESERMVWLLDWRSSRVGDLLGPQILEGMN